MSQYFNIQVRCEKGKRPLNKGTEGAVVVGRHGVCLSLLWGP